MISCIVLYTLFTLLFVLYQKYQLMELRGEYPEKSSKNWHTLAILMKLLIVVMFVFALFPTLGPSIQDVVLAVSINLFVWDMGINKLALNVGVWSLGTNTIKDKIIGKHQWKIYSLLFLIALLLKIFT